MDFLLGVPGKLKTLTDRLSATWAANVARRKPCASIINYYSSGGVSGPLGLGSSIEKEINAKGTACGALTATVLATVINRAGAGCIRFLAANTVDATSRTIRMKVTIDGVVVFDATTNAIAASYSGLVAVGGAYYGSTTSFAFCYGRLEYDTSFKVEIASSLTETDKIKVWTNEELR